MSKSLISLLPFLVLLPDLAHAGPPRGATPGATPPPAPTSFPGTPSVNIVVVTHTTARPIVPGAGPGAPTATWDFEWLALGDSERVEVDAEWASNSTENLKLLFDEIMFVQNKDPRLANGTLEIALDQPELRSDMIDILAEPFLNVKNKKFDTWMSLLEQEYSKYLRECPYDKCAANKCLYQKGGDRIRDGLLNEACIGKRNMIRYNILKSDRDTILGEMKERLRDALHIPFGPGSRLAGDWACTGLRKDSFGCPTITIEGVTTTLTQTYVYTFFGVRGIGSRTVEDRRTKPGTQSLSANHPAITEVNEWGPDKFQPETLITTLHGWSTCLHCEPDTYGRPEVPDDE